MKKTAVEWLIEQLNINGTVIPMAIEYKAKVMENEQIKNAWLNSLTKGDFNSADEYYNETFKKEA